MTYTFDINPESSSVSNSNISFYTTTAWDIKSINIKATATAENAKLSLRLSCGDRSFTTETIDVKGTDYYKLDVSLTCPAHSTISFVLNRTNCNIYSGNDVIIAGGYSSGGCYAMQIEIEYEEWEQGDSGYFSPSGKEPEEFVFFTQDDRGYPLNYSAWSFDPEVNDGYPFFASIFADPLAQLLIIKTGSEWVTGRAVIFKNKKVELIYLVALQQKERDDS